MTRIHFRTLLFLALPALVCAMIVPAFADSNELFFPLRHANIITSTFGEYRIGHPHAGLDFSTNLQIGVPVVAADDGSIFRIKISTLGYGKVIYQRTTSGKILVYAHLDDFSSKIKKTVLRLQKQNGRYNLNHTFGPSEIVVKRGEVIAYSGDTGTDLPHLHFEVRDSSNMVLNPLLNGLSIPDTTPPSIQKIHALPLEFDAHTDHSWHEKIYDFEKRSDGVYTLKEPLRIGGQTGLAVQVTDYADNTNRLLNPYFIEFQINGQRVYRVQYDRYSYAEGAISELDYEVRLRETRLGTFHRLYQLYNPISLHPFKELTGDLTTLRPGRYAATIIAGDADGNRSRAEFQLVINVPPTVHHVDFQEEGDKLAIRVIPDDKDGQVTKVHMARRTTKDWENITAIAMGKGVYESLIPKPEEPTEFKVYATDEYGAKSNEFTTIYSPKSSEKPVGEIKVRPSFTIRNRTVSLLLLRGAGFSFSPTFTVTVSPPPPSNQPIPYHFYQEETAIRVNAPVPDGWYGGDFVIEGRFKDKQGNLYFGKWTLPLQVAKKSGGIVASADGNAQMVFPVGGTYQDVPLTVERIRPSEPSWLKSITDTYDFSRVWEPMRKNARVALAIPDGLTNLQQVGLYQYDRGVWWFLGSERQGKQMVARPSHMGAFALMRDVAPPQIGKIHPDGITDDLKPTIVVEVSDSGSGLFSGGIDFKLDGVSKMVDWHPIRHRLTYHPEKPMDVGAHKILVTLTDRAGNTATGSATFTISK